MPLATALCMLTLLSELAFLCMSSQQPPQWAVLTGRKITESSNCPSFIGRIVQESFQGVAERRRKKKPLTLKDESKIHSPQMYSLTYSWVFFSFADMPLILGGGGL